jgi:hypothetical protein
MTRSGLPAFDNSIVKPDPTLFSIDLSGTQLSPDQQWGCYTVEYYQTVAQLLSELIDRPQIRASDVQSAISTIEQISQTMTQPGIVTDQELED